MPRLFVAVGVPAAAAAELALIQPPRVAGELSHDFVEQLLDKPDVLLRPRVRVRIV